MCDDEECLLLVVDDFWVGGGADDSCVALGESLGVVGAVVGKSLVIAFPEVLSTSPSGMPPAISRTDQPVAVAVVCTIVSRYASVMCAPPGTFHVTVVSTVAASPVCQVCAAPIPDPGNGTFVP